jgi:hypothetical protein
MIVFVSYVSPPPSLSDGLCRLFRDKLLGGDSDTIACIAGGIAEAFYGEIPEKIFNTVSVIVGPDLMGGVVRPFSRKSAFYSPGCPTGQRSLKTSCRLRNGMEL